MNSIHPSPDRQDLLRKNYAVLANQRQVLETLTLAMQIGYGNTDWYEQADALLHLVSREVCETVELIVNLSDLDKSTR